MTTTPARPVVRRGRPTGARGRQGEGRSRVLAAALELVGERGFHGTSLQMIADRIGVTKAAVYYQFPAKTDIAAALLAPVLEGLRRVADEAEAEPPGPARRRRAVQGLVDLQLAQRPLMAALARDPGLQRAVADDVEWTAVHLRVDAALVAVGDGRPSPSDLVAASVVRSGFACAAADPQLAGLDDGAVGAALRDLAARLL